MPATFFTRGDPLPQIDVRDPSADDTRSRGLLWGLDLTGCASRRHARYRWHEAAQELKQELDRHPSVRRVCVACTRPARFPQSALVRVPQGLALQIHNDLERDRGRYVQVLVLDITDCGRSVVLRDRLDEALGERGGSWNALTLDWEDIEGCRFREAWERETL